MADAKRIDKRTYQRYIEKGVLKDSDYQSHLKSLPDETSNADWVELDIYETELGLSDSEDSDPIEEEDSEPIA